jgi:transposase
MFTMPKKPVGEPRIRKQYTREFKDEAVRQVVAGGRPVVEVARALGLRPAVLRDWMRVLRGPGRPDRPALTSQDEELRRLRKRVQELEEERDILGKAMAFFAKRNG